MSAVSLQNPIGIVPVRQPEQTLMHFREAIQSRASLYLYSDGRWDIRWKITQLIRRLFGFETSDDLEVAHFFVKYLKGFETTTPLFTQRLHATPEKLTEIRSTAAAIIERLRGHLSSHDRKIRDMVQHTIFKINKHVVANEYRSMPQASIPTAAAPSLQEDHEWFTNAFLTWKRERNLPAPLSDEEQQKLRDAAYYSRFIELIKEDLHTRDTFFRFVFRNTKGGCNDAVHIAIQFPVTRKRIMQSFLDKRLRRVQNNGLALSEQAASNGGGQVTKDVTILIEGRAVSLRDLERPITLRDGEVRPLREILKVFTDKNIAMGDYEYTAQGIEHCFPKRPRVDFTKRDWWKDLPEFETLSREQLIARYFPTNPPQTDFYGLVVARASREFDVPRVDKNHAWLQIIIPREDGRFSVLPFGKYRNYYASNMLEEFSGIFQTAENAVIAYPDENECYYHRKHCALPFLASQEEIERILLIIRKDMLEAIKGNLVFQPQGDNCSTWVRQTLEATFPDRQISNDPERPLFEVDILTTTGPVPVKYITGTLATIRRLFSQAVANICRIVFCTILGAWQGVSVIVMGSRIVKRLLNYPKWLNGILSLPSALFQARGNITLQEYV